MASPLDEFDDYPVHQAAEPLARVGSFHPKWTERWYFNVQRADGTLVGVFGGGFYPNTGVLETYACLLHDGRQYNVRSQVVQRDRLALDTGEGARFTVDEPMKRWRIGCTDDVVTADLTFAAKHQPHLFQPFNTPADAAAGDPYDVDLIQHFVQPGQLTGEVGVDGARFRLVGGMGFRDRTWGIRSRRPRLHSWFVVHLADGGYLTAIRQERADGTVMTSELCRVAADGERRYAVIDDHAYDFDPSTRLLTSGALLGHTPDGQDVELAFENTGEGVRLAGAGYVAAQGERRADGSEHGEVWDLRDPSVIAAVGPGTIDSPIRAGLRWGQDHVDGLGVSEFAVARDHHRYAQRFSDVRNRK